MYTHNQAEHGAILRAYGHRLPALAVAPHLVDLLVTRFGRPARVVPQPLETFWRPARFRRRPSSPPRILVMSPFEIDWKGVPTALHAVRLLRQQGHRCQLVRLSQWPLSDAERALLEADEFHHHLAPRDAAGLVRGCDLLLAPSWEQEGFGLPVLEAMASGVPVVASDIASFRGFAAPAAALVPHDQPQAFADMASKLLGDAAAWRRRRGEGVELCRQYQEGPAGRQAEAAMYWVADGSWERD